MLFCFVQVNTKKFYNHIPEMDDEKDPHLQKEAQRIARTMGNAQKKKPSPERLEEQRRIQMVNQTAAVVRLVNSHNPDRVMEQETVYLKDGRIPLKGKNFRRFKNRFL